MMRLKDLEPGGIYVRARQSKASTAYYTKPRISREAYMRKLERKKARLSGREVYTLTRLVQGWALLALVWRYRSEGRRLEEKRLMIAVPQGTKLRKVKNKPYPKE